MKTSECLTTDSAPVMLTMAALSQEYGAKKIGIPEFKSQVSRSRTPNGNEVEPFLLKIEKILFSKKCA